ncbi:MAG: winged helix-turn-helix domain-containing protein [Minisyncoccia bacterium]
MKVLLYVRDDPTIAASLRALVQNEGRSVALSPLGLLDTPALRSFIGALSGYDALLTCAGTTCGQNYQSLRAMLVKIREARSAIPIVVFTDDDPIQEAQLLIAGASYCVGEPMLDPNERAHLIRAALERVTRRPEEPEAISYEIKVGGLVLNTNTFCLSDTSRHTEIRLTRSEAKMLGLIMGRPKIAFSRDQLMDVAYADGVYVDDRTIDSHVKRIRAKKLRALHPEAGSCIETIYGAGYRFVDEKARLLFPVPPAITLAVSA